MSNIKNAIKALSSIESTTKRGLKHEILEREKNNKYLHKIFFLVSDPMVTYGVNPKEDPSKYKDIMPFMRPKTAFRALVNLCHRLSLRELTGNKAGREVSKFISSQHPKFRKWAIRILRQNLRIGVKASTLGPIWPDLVSDFGVPLANNLTTTKPGEDPVVHYDWIKYPTFAEPKYDGINLSEIFPGNKYPITFLIEGQSKYCLSRGQIHYPMVENLWNKIKRHIPSDHFVIAEAYARWSKKERLIYSGPWSKASSLLKTGMTPTGFKPELISKKQREIFDRDFQLIIYELGSTRFYSQEHEYTDPTIRRKRRKRLVKLVKEINHPNILYSPSKTIHNKKGLIAYYEKCIDEGFEGIMIKDPEAPLRMGRTDDMFKLKPEQDVSGVIVGIYKGNGRNKDWAGSLRVYLPDYKIITKCNLRSDKDRYEFWAHRSKYIGMQADFKKQKEPKGAEISKSRFIIYKRPREDLKRIPAPKCAILLEKY